MTARRKRSTDVSMRCDQFLDGYSEFRDGLLPREEARDFEEHLERCSCCARYDRVVRRGQQLLSTLPAACSSEDFMARLRHRLYNVDDGLLTTSHRRLGGSAALIGVAAVGLLALFWLPFASSVPVELELPAVAVDTPPPSAGAVPALFRQGPFVSSRLLPKPSYLDGDAVQWPPQSHVRSLVILDSSHRRAEPSKTTR